jgi:hypothetical protein
MNGYTARTTFARRIAHGYSREPTNVQKIEFDVTTTEGPSRVTIVTGTMPISLAAFGKPGKTAQRGSFKVVLDPSLTSGQIRRATSTVSFGAREGCGLQSNGYSMMLEPPLTRKRAGCSWLSTLRLGRLVPGRRPKLLHLFSR